MTEKKKWQTLSDTLEEMERTDPKVRTAAESYNRMVDHLTRGVPVTRFHKSTADHPVQVERK